MRYQKRLAIVAFSVTIALAQTETPQNYVLACTGAGPQACRDDKYAVSFTLPVGWSIQRAIRWANDNKQNTVALNDPQSIPGEMHPSLWYMMLDTPVGRTQAELLSAMQEWSQKKVLQRRNSGLADYQLRPNSCYTRSVGSLAGWSCIGEFTDHTGKAMAEYLTWTSTGNSGAEFFGSIPVSGLNSYMARFDAIIETLRIP